MPTFAGMTTGGGLSGGWPRSAADAARPRRLLSLLLRVSGRKLSSLQVNNKLGRRIG